MSRNTDHDTRTDTHRGNYRSRAAVSVLVLLPVVIAWALLATNDDENIALTRNDVMGDAASGQTWHGAMTNATDSQYRDIAVTIRFLDSDGKPVGALSDQVDMLEPGQQLQLQAPLPDGAERMQVYSLEWCTGRKDKHVSLGPWAPWAFGYVQTEWP